MRYAAFLFCFIFCFISLGSIADEERKIVLRKPSDTKHGKYLEHYYNNLYQMLGYEIEYVDVPSELELELVDKGILAGLIARDTSYSEMAPHLTKIDVPIFSYQVFLVADRRRCGYCLVEQITEINIPAGIKVFADIAEDLPNRIKRNVIGSREQTPISVFKERNIAQFYSSISLPPSFQSNSHLLKKVVDTRFDHHFLAPKYSHLKPKLERIITEKELLGYLPAMRDKYQIDMMDLSVTSDYKDVFAISSEWVDYTNADGTGVYWDMLKTIFSEQYTFTHKTTSWIDAVQQFRKMNADILVSTYAEDAKGYLLSSYHIDYEYEVFAVSKSKVKLNQFINSKQSYKVCASEDLNFLLEQFGSAHQVYSVDECEQLLINGEVDIMLEYDYNFSQPVQEFHRVAVLEPKPLFVAFQNTPKGKYLKGVFDAKIERLAKKGKLATLFPSVAEFDHANIN
jgi:hypothetical protein